MWIVCQVNDIYLASIHIRSCLKALTLSRWRTMHVIHYTYIYVYKKTNWTPNQKAQRKGGKGEKKLSLKKKPWTQALWGKPSASAGWLEMGRRKRGTEARMGTTIAVSTTVMVPSCQLLEIFSSGTIPKGCVKTHSLVCYPIAFLYLTNASKTSKCWICSNVVLSFGVPDPNFCCTHCWVSCGRVAWCHKCRYCLPHLHNPQ